MKFSNLMVILCLTQGTNMQAAANVCSYSEEYFADDDTCAEASSVGGEIMDDDKLNTCNDYEGEFSIITECSATQMVAEYYNKDSKCAVMEKEYVYPAGGCVFDYEEDGVKYYSVITVTVPAEEQAFGRLSAIGSIFTLAAMMANM